MVCHASRNRVTGPAVHERGYAMLAALVVVALAFLVVGTCLALVSSATRVRAADETSATTLALAERGLADARERIRWGWAGRQAAGVAEMSPHVAADGGTYTITLERLAELPAPVPSSSPTAAGVAVPPGTRSYRVEVGAAVGKARRDLRALVVVSPVALPRGLAVERDLETGDLVEVSGCGVYVGGDVRGREHIVVGSPSGRDEALPETYATPGVHAAGGIFAAGVEEHEGGAAPAVDSDPHVGGAPPTSSWRSPPPSVLGDLAGHAASPAAALVGDTLSLDALPAAPDVSGAAGSADGVIVVIRAPAAGGGLRIEGVRPAPPAACALTLVVEGDATVTAPAALGGELVITGTLRVEAPLAVSGSLAAGALAVASPLRVDLASGWAEQPPPGSLATAVTWWSDAPRP